MLKLDTIQKKKTNKKRKKKKSDLSHPWLTSFLARDDTLLPVKGLALSLSIDSTDTEGVLVVDHQIPGQVPGRHGIHHTCTAPHGPAWLANLDGVLQDGCAAVMLGGSPFQFCWILRHSQDLERSFRGWGHVCRHNENGKGYLRSFWYYTATVIKLSPSPPPSPPTTTDSINTVCTHPFSTAFRTVE